MVQQETLQDETLDRLYGEGEYPESLLDFFHWGAFALPHVWGIVYGSWFILWAMIAALVGPTLLLSSMGSAAQSSLRVYFGVLTIQQICLWGVRLWAGMNANKLYWRRMAQINKLVGMSAGMNATVPLARPRKRLTIGNYLTKQRQWGMVSMLLFIPSLIIAAFFDYSMMLASSGQQAALFVVAHDFLWALAPLIGGYYIASKGTVLMDPFRRFVYRARKTPPGL